MPGRQPKREGNPYGITLGEGGAIDTSRVLFVSPGQPVPAGVYFIYPRAATYPVVLVHKETKEQWNIWPGRGLHTIAPGWESAPSNSELALSTNLLSVPLAMSRKIPAIVKDGNRWLTQRLDWEAKDSDPQTVFFPSPGFVMLIHGGVGLGTPAVLSVHPAAVDALTAEADYINRGFAGDTGLELSGSYRNNQDQTLPPGLEFDWTDGSQHYVEVVYSEVRRLQDALNWNALGARIFMDGPFRVALNSVDASISMEVLVTWGGLP